MNFQVSDYNLDPPEDKELAAVASYFEYIEFEFCIKVTIGEDGYWETANDVYNFTQNPDHKDGDWYGESFYIRIADPTEVLECMDELMPDLHEYSKGSYEMNGYVKLVFTVNGVEIDKIYQGDDEDGEPIFDIEYYTGNAKVMFNKGESEIINLKLRRLS